jgi:hypothetical protein
VQHHSDRLSSLSAKLAVLEGHNEKPVRRLQFPVMGLRKTATTVERKEHGQEACVVKDRGFYNLTWNNGTGTGADADTAMSLDKCYADQRRGYKGERRKRKAQYKVLYSCTHRQQKQIEERQQSMLQKVEETQARVLALQQQADLKLDELHQLKQKQQEDRVRRLCKKGVYGGSQKSKVEGAFLCR